MNSWHPARRAGIEHRSGVPAILFCVLIFFSAFVNALPEFDSSWANFSIPSDNRISLLVGRYPTSVGRVLPVVRFDGVKYEPVSWAFLLSGFSGISGIAFGFNQKYRVLFDDERRYSGGYSLPFNLDRSFPDSFRDDVTGAKNSCHLNGQFISYPVYSQTQAFWNASGYDLSDSTDVHSLFCPVVSDYREPVGSWLLPPSVNSGVIGSLLSRGFKWIPSSFSSATTYTSTRWNLCTFKSFQPLSESSYSCNEVLPVVFDGFVSAHYFQLQRSSLPSGFFYKAPLVDSPSHLVYPGVWDCRIRPVANSVTGIVTDQFSCEGYSVSLTASPCGDSDVCRFGYIGDSTIVANFYSDMSELPDSSIRFVRGGYFGGSGFIPDFFDPDKPDTILNTSLFYGSPLVFSGIDLDSGFKYRVTVSVPVGDIYNIALEVDVLRDGVLRTYRESLDINSSGRIVNTQVINNYNPVTGLPVGATSTIFKPDDYSRESTSLRVALAAEAFKSSNVQAVIDLLSRLQSDTSLELSYRQRFADSLDSLRFWLKDFSGTPSDPVSASDAGLKDSFLSFLSVLNPFKSLAFVKSAECPVTEFDAFGQHFLVDGHCQVGEYLRDLLNVGFALVYGIVALMIILGA